ASRDAESTVLEIDSAVQSSVSTRSSSTVARCTVVWRSSTNGTVVRRRSSTVTRSDASVRAMITTAATNTIITTRAAAATTMAATWLVLTSAVMASLRVDGAVKPLGVGESLVVHFVSPVDASPSNSASLARPQDEGSALSTCKDQ